VSTRLVRTKATYLIYAVLGFYGWYIYGFGPVVPLLRDEEGTSRTVASLHGTALAVGALVAGGLYPFLVRRIGRGRTLWVTLAGLAIGVVILVSVPAVPAATIGAILFCSIAGSTLVNIVAPALLDAHGPQVSGAAVSEGNAIATGTGLVAPLAVGLSLDLGFGWRPALLIAAVIALGIAVVARLTGARLAPAQKPAMDAMGPAVAGPMPRRFWLAWLVVICCIGAEFATTLWASDVVRARTGAGAALATSAVTAVIGGMCAGRIAGSRLAVRYAGSSLLFPALAVALLGTGVFWAATSPVLAMVGLALCGLGLGPLYPLGIDLAMAASDGQLDRAAAYASYGAGLAVGGGPFALGWLADRIGPHAAYLVVPLLFGLAGLGLTATRRASAARSDPEGDGGDVQPGQQAAEER
jgi:MFS family permease